MERLLSIEQTATVLALSPSTVRDMVKKRKLASIRLGKRVLVENVEIERFLDKCRAEQKASDKQPLALEEQNGQ